MSRVPTHANCIGNRGKGMPKLPWRDTGVWRSQAQSTEERDSWSDQTTLHGTPDEAVFARLSTSGFGSMVLTN